MENSLSDKDLKVLYDRFMGSFIENRDPRMDLEISALKQLKGAYLEKAKIAILERLEKSPSLDAIWSAKAINLADTVPIMKRWLSEIRSNPASEYRSSYYRGQLAYALYEFLKDESYIPDVIQTVDEEGYGEFTSGIFMLNKMPLTVEGLAAVWNKYRKGKAIKEPHSWKENCAWFLREKVKEPIGQSFLSGLPEDEQKELLEFIGESGHQRLERKFRLERYVYGRERYKKEEVNRFDEYVKIGGSPVKGMTLKQLWKGHSGGIHTITWSPDGRYLASTPSSALTADSIRIWSLESSQCLRELEPVKKDRYDRHEPKRIAWISNDKRQLAVAYDYSALGTRGQRVSVWDAEEGKLMPYSFEADQKTYINELFSFPDGKTLLVNISNMLFLVDIVTQKKERILEAYSGRFETMSISPNGKIIAIGYYDLKDPNTGVNYQPGFYGEGVSHEVLYYDVLGKKVVYRFNTGHLQGLNKLCWVPGKLALAIASSDNTISIWDVRKNERMALLESEGFVGRISGLEFSSNGALLASKSESDNLLRIWRTDKWEEVVALRELSSYNSFSFHPSLAIFASVCSLREANDNSSDAPTAIRIWEFDNDAFFSNPPFMEEFNERETEIRTKLLREEITEDLEYVKVGGSPAKGVSLRQILKGHTGRIHEVSWSPDGRFLASPSDDKTVRIWDDETGACIYTFEEKDEVKHCSWSPNGQELVYGGKKQIRLWNAKTAKSVDLLHGDFLRLDSLQFSPDGKRLALAYRYNTIQILDTSTWKEVGKKLLDSRSDHRINLEWSDDGSQIVANPVSGFIHVLDSQTLKLRKTIAIPGERDEMFSFSFMYTKYRNKVAVAEDKKPIMIFDLLSGQMERKLSEFTSYTSGLSFSPDGTIFVSWSQDNSVYFWRTDTGQKLARIHEYSLRVVEPVYPKFHPTKPSLVTFCDKRRSMRVWDIDYKELLG